jgi:hypothetical protein
MHGRAADEMPECFGRTFFSDSAGEVALPLLAFISPEKTRSNYAMIALSERKFSKINYLREVMRDIGGW